MSKLFNNISILCTSIGAFLSVLFGGLDNLIITLCAFMVIDYITGVLSAIYNKKLSSQIGYKGIIKKVTMLIVVAVSVLLQNKIGIPAIRDIVILFFISNEGISILENVSSTGLKLPPKLKEVLKQLRDKGE